MENFEKSPNLDLNKKTEKEKDFSQLKVTKKIKEETRQETNIITRAIVKKEIEKTQKREEKENNNRMSKEKKGELSILFLRNYLHQPKTLLSPDTKIAKKININNDEAIQFIQEINQESSEISEERRGELAILFLRYYLRQTDVLSNPVISPTIGKKIGIDAKEALQFIQITIEDSIKESLSK